MGKGLNTVTEDIKHILQQLHPFTSDSLKLQELDQTKQRIDAVFQQSSLTSQANVDDVMTLTKAYHKYKRDYVKQLVFTPQKENLTTILEHAPLEAVHIYFDTATYDEIERDEKVTMEAQLGLIGGTMGLLTGFSILSGVEIVYFLLRFFLSLKTQRSEVVESVGKRFENHLTRK